MQRNGLVSRLSGFAVSGAAASALIFICFRLLHANATTVALFMLLLVLGAATWRGAANAIFTSVVCVLGLNYFFLPPIGGFTIADPENWVAFFAFLVTAITVSQLSSRAKRRAEEAVARQDEIGKLYELSRAMLMDETQDARAAIVKSGQILGLRNIAFYERASNQVYGSLEGSGMAESALIHVAESGLPDVRDDSSVIPVRFGTRVLGSLAASGGRLGPAVLESVASLLAINYERARALNQAGAAELARRSEEFRSALLDGLAHDLKTPLTAIRTCVTRLIAIPPRTEAVRQELMNIIDQESLRLQRSITEAIQLARIESKELRLHREWVKAEDVVNAAVAGMREEDPRRYRVDIPAGLTLNVDPDLIRRALMQILENARKYALRDSVVEIEARPAEGQAIIAISDRGPGIAPSELERIFDKFYRGRQAGSASDGTGMGLAIAKGIVEAHGGEIRAENRTGGGAVISFSLPFGTASNEHSNDSGG